jgi:hypothetical protein
VIEWLLRKLRRTPPPAVPAAAQREAEEELTKAQAELRKSEQQAAAAHRMADNLERVNRENHFAERALMALKGIVQ